MEHLITSSILIGRDNLKIPFYKIYWDEEDVEAVSQVIRRGSWWTKGKEVGEFEEEIAQTVNRSYAIALNSGTSALNASMEALGIGEGDEVIVPSFTFIATALAPSFVGAKPVFADIERERLGLDPEDVKERITSKTAAIIPIHYGGLPCHIKALSEIAEDNGIFLVEDSAEALGAQTDDRKTGSFGDISIMSFTGGKIITMGEGGMVMTNSEKLRDKIESIREKYSWRMPTIVAALGLSQLEKLSLVIGKRRNNARIYTKAFEEIEDITPPKEPDGCFNVYFLYTVKVDKGRDELQEYLTEQGISTKVYFHPLHKDPLKLPVTEELSRQVLTLPIYPSMTDVERNFILDNIRGWSKRK